MKVAITGATGIIGRGLIEAFSRDYPDWEVTALSRNPLPPGVCAWQKLDVGDYDATYKTITKLNPDVVIHLAAMSKPEQCLKEPEEAMRVNFLGTRNIALACARFDAELMFLSTDQVFYGAGDKVHGEYDTPKANNHYAHTKVLAERYIKEHLQRWWIIRPGKVFGGPGDSTSFMYNAFTTLSAGKTLRVVKDWSAHMTHSFHFGQALGKIIQKKTYGIYHVANPEVPNYQEVGEYLAQVMGAPKNLLSAISQKELGLKVERASYLELSTAMWRMDFGKDVPSWKEGVQLFVSERSRV